MKKKKILGLIVSSLLFFTGCMNNNKNIIDEFKKNVDNMDNYHIAGTLEVINNDTTYKYDIDVAYKDDEKYRVSLKNTTNDHEQIILKNNTGVYVLTPSLNKSFKFQSEWPYNNSQSYLYQTILNDIENDSSAEYKETDSGYVITSTVNYANNKDLVNQKIYLDKKLNITKVEVYNKDGIAKIKMTYKNTDTNKDFEDSYFELNNNIDNKTAEQSKSTMKLDDIIYPLYLPDNTSLESQDTISTKDGERVILTFSGDSPFTLIQETIIPETEHQIISVYGDLEFVNDTIGSVSEGTINWISNGIEYYAVSDTLNTTQLLEVANSLNVIPVGK